MMEENNLDVMLALASDGRKMIGINNDQRQNLETLTSVSAQAAIYLTMKCKMYLIAVSWKL